MKTTSLTKRQLLLGLKDNLMEGGFSTVMMVLTIVNGAFVVGFAKEVLHLSTKEIGVLTALPFVAGFFQPFTSAAAARLGHRKAVAIAFSLVAVCLWLVIAWMPWWCQQRRWTVIFLLLITVISFTLTISGVAWMGWMSDFVPEQIRGRFFGRRNVICGAVNMFVMLVAGWYLDLFREGGLAWAFAMLFSVSAIFRLLGMYYLGRVPDTGAPETGGIGRQMRNLGTVLRDGNYMVFVVFSMTFGFFLNLAAPFYTVYMIDHLRQTLGTIAMLGVVAGVGALVSTAGWGKLSDRFGHKPVMIVAGATWLGSALGWMFTAPDRWRFVYILFFVGGLMSAGFVLGQFNILLKLVHAEAKTAYISIFVSLTSLAAAAAPILGGQILDALQDRRWEALGLELTPFHLLFLMQLVPALLSLLILARLREPAERRVSEVIGAMRQMREFNPILGFGFLVQRVFTPSGLAGVARKGARALHETRKVAREVGEDLAEEAEKLVKPENDSSKRRNH